MAREILKQWVALLEFKVDKNQAQDMVLGVHNIATGVTALAAAFEAAALGISAALIKTSESSRQTYLISQELGVSAERLEKFNYAVQMAGGSSDRSTAALRKFADEIRSSPGFRQELAQRFHLSDVYDKETGQAKNVLDSFMSYLQQLNDPKRFAGYEVKTFRERIGLSFADFKAITGGEMGHFEEEAAKKIAAAGVDIDKAIENGEHLARAWESLKESVYLIWLRFNQEMSPELTQQIKELTTYIDQHSKEISAGLIMIADKIKELALGLKDGLVGFWTAHKGQIKEVWDNFDVMLKEFAKLTGATNEWQAALELLATYIITKFIFGIMSGLLGITGLVNTNPWLRALMIAVVAGTVTWESIAKWARDPNANPGVDPMHAGMEPHLDISGLTPDSPGGATRWLQEKWRNLRRRLGGGDGAAGPVVGGANLMSSGQYPAVPGENLTTITLDSGKKVTVHADAAPSFKGFLNELEKTGYNIGSLSGFNFRNKAGGGGLSEHAFGNAIDINPATNPFRSSQTDMPTNVSEMAAKWGLSWGGDWSRGSRDPMHFEWRGVRPWEQQREMKPGQPAKPGQAAIMENLRRAPPERGAAPANDNIKLPEIPATDASDIFGRFEPSSFTAARSSANTNFNQSVAVNIHGGDRGPATKNWDLASPYDHSRLGANFKNKAE